jgi:hypothetical protein
MSPRRTTAAGATVPTVVGVAVVLVGAAVALDVVGDTADDAVARVVDVDAGGAARSEVLQATPTNSNATADADARQLGRRPVASTLK